MNALRKSVLLLLGSTLALSSLAACSTEKKAAEENQPKETKQPTVKVLVANNAKFPDGMNENNNPYINYIRENTNINLKYSVTPPDGYLERLNVIMASGDLPDIIHTADPIWMVNYINQKALEPLNDVIEKYGPDLKKLIPEKAWANVTVDGKIYAIPSIKEAQGDFIMYGRKDWLDKLGLKPPKTLDEYVNVMKTFRDKDPNGNGKNDVLGISFGEKLARTEPFFGAFGVQLDQWVNRDGKLVYSSTLPETKQALEFMAKLYKEKLLDQEFALNKGEIFDQKVASGKLGLFAAAYYDTRYSIKTSKDNDKNADWISFDFPVGPAGKSGTRGDNIVSGYAVVPKGKDAANAIKVLNFIMGKGYKTLQLGFEGQVWSMKDGKVVTNFEEHNKSIYRGMYASIANPATLRRERLDSLGAEFKLNDNIDKIHAAAIYSEYLSTPTPAMGKYGQSVKDKEQEVFTKIIMGIAPLDDFDKFVESFKKDGGNEMTKEVNDWYAKTKK